ncbi:HET-domain-containing protein [Polyplosphaeria fusca]|uniref:HET-domain-containing protein n=1 Tax=Polyplosphaeria fusca TaxID=682080 RepID=A0A9P4V2Z6_9PLEO|nr:HET-domain-containing protein [Polyplosphaeria fusca]
MSISGGGSKATNLRDVIEAEMVMCNSSSRRFLPEAVLQRLLTKDVVEATLALHSSKFKKKVDVKDLTAFVCNDALKIFAILVWEEKEKLIERFFTTGFRDVMLPVTRKPNSDSAWDVEPFEAKFKEMSIATETFTRHEWKASAVNHFCTNDQFLFLSPVFNQDQFRYTFHEQCPMPFLNRDKDARRGSNFSVVDKWRLHRDHFQYRNVAGQPGDSEQHPEVAVKELTEWSSKDDFRDAVEAEVKALELLRKLNHRHLIRAIAYYNQGAKHFIVTPWAGLGNLRDFWEKQAPPPELDPSYLRWMLTQLCGLAAAIRKLHYPEGDPTYDPEADPETSNRSYRHGDLKPDNILCFKEHGNAVGGTSGPCVLVVADVGLTKSHSLATEVRIHATQTKTGTVMYEPPEAEFNKTEPRSRRYDIWSMGCIYFEFIIWLLYGFAELERFRGELGVDRKFYSTEQPKSSRVGTGELHTSVRKWVEWIQKDSRCPENTAIGRLMQLIIRRLLVANVGALHRVRRTESTIHTPSSENSNPASPTIIRTSTNSNGFAARDDVSLISRAGAIEMDNEMKGILEDAEIGRTSWLQFDKPSQLGPQGKFGEHLTTSDANLKVVPTAKTKEEYRFEPLDDDWEYTADSEIAHTVLPDPDTVTKETRGSLTPSLCSHCSALDLWRSKCTFSKTYEVLRKVSWKCDLCSVLRKYIDGHVNRDIDQVTFSKAGSSLICSATPRYAIGNVYIHPGFEHTTNGVQLGLSKLSEPGSRLHVKIMAQWIRSCDLDHQCVPPKEDSLLPTRVLEVGETDDAAVRLFCTSRDQFISGKYLALSHRWGSPAQHRKFCTFQSNLERFKEGIDVHELPKTFRDAIQITRSLGVRYLWIDSLCIVQDNREDWDHESKLMERVFSSAYVTLAATCAGGTDDGFLKQRPKRQCVVLTKQDRNGEMPYDFCEAIDNFAIDVDQGELNKRGWVLQERALSRRTIYFAEKQTYWECGKGVRCETLTKMKNRKASFLGDANFPHSVSDYVKGMKIQLFQSLYVRYSNLALSYAVDRPVAIKGLEKRLVRTLNTWGGFGIFNIYLHRFLLWQRTGTTLTRILKTRERDEEDGRERVPSWSWMAYEGGIEYMEVPFGMVAWTEEIVSPFQHPYQSQRDDDSGVMPELSVKAWVIVEPEKRDFVLDEPALWDDRRSEIMCVVLGVQKQILPDHHQLQYVLLVAAIKEEEEESMYERVGVAALETQYIGMHENGGSGIDIRIQ